MKTLKELREKSVSQAQQKMMGMALAYKRGEMDDASPEVKKMADSMSMKDLEDFAKTKHKGLPVKKESVELEEATDYFKVAKAFDDYAKKSGGIDKASFMKVGAFVRQLGKESDVNKQDKTFMAMKKFIGGMDTDPRDGVIQIFQKHGMYKDGRIMRESAELDEAAPKVKGNSGPWSKSDLQKAFKAAKVDVAVQARITKALREM